MGKSMWKNIPHEHHRSRFRSFVSELEGLLDPEDFGHQYLSQVLTSKLLDPAFADTPEARQQAAIDKWLSVEERNQLTNSRLEALDGTESVFDGGPSVSHFESFVRGLIRGVVGDQPSRDLPYEVLDTYASFTNGASTSTRRGPGTVPRKFQSGCDSTPGVISVFREMNNSSHWHPLPNFVEGNVLFTVPKTTTIDRVACKEPDLNVYVQKGIGGYIRSRLRDHGIDLNDQTVNQRLALLGSLTGDLATVDLSSASDTVTVGVSERLMPSWWHTLLLSARSPRTFVRGEWHDNAMLSSMGNACTFEVESLIFWALTRGVCYFTRSRGRVSVYGDDIICPTQCVGQLFEVLEFYGFVPNQEKSHFDGGFRESCGKHYFNGADVSPFYLRKVPTDTSDWIHILNSLRHWLERQSLGDILDSRFFEIWNTYSREFVPRPLWGGWDPSRRDVLVAYGRRPLARLGIKQIRAKSEERRSQFGAYLQWLHAAEGRHQPIETALVTSEFSGDGKLSFGRLVTPIWGRPTKVFVEELD